MKKNNNGSSNKKIWLIPLSIILIIPVIWVLIVRLEGSKPEINIDFPDKAVGASFEINGNISDRGTGVRNLWIGILQNGSEKMLLDLDFPSAAVYQGGESHYEVVKKRVDVKGLALTDGKAIVRIAVKDFSWRNKGKGNITYVEKELTIDTTPPEIDVLSTRHNVSQGGTGLVVYKVSEPDLKTGVFVGDKFYPGHPGYFKDTKVHLAFFSVGHTQDRDTRIYVSAEDEAGNKKQAGFHYYIKKRVFKEDRINVSDHFMNWKMPEFDTREFGVVDDTGLKKFLAVNSKLRLKNSEQVTSPGKNTDEKMYWEGRFGRLPNSANRAGFADHRSYFYNGEQVDDQYHMGIDLASIKHSDVPASNNGKVVLTENIGIYGKTVVIDHGFGLFSLYSHLSQIDVSAGQIVSKGDVIGKTGTTGLAIGDHLHYGMYVHQTFVNPIEWWDAEWIRNNITSKLDEIEMIIK